jgi:uncharacterized protein (TIGR02246 family)
MSLLEERALEERIQRLEDRDAIRELIAQYGFSIDDRDIEGIAALFTPDACFRSVDGVMNATGRDAVVQQFHGRFAVLGPSNHFTHDRVVRFDPANADLAFGTVSSHAEVVRNGTPMITALRYADTYQKLEGRWYFKERVVSFLYYLPPQDYAGAWNDRFRMRAYGDRRPADFPEGLPNWEHYHSDTRK